MLKKRNTFRATFFLVISCLWVLLADIATAAERVTYHHFDALGSTVAASDEQGNVVWRETYQPYGERIQNQAAASSNTRWYTGHVQDSETGLVYAGARYYDPALGRFMAVDPKGFSESNLQSFNRFAYGNNNPYNYVDPDGRASFSVSGGVTASFSFGGWEAVYGRQVGIAISFPTSLTDPSVFDLGITVTSSAGGAAGPGVPKLRASVGPVLDSTASRGSVTDLEGRSTEVGLDLGAAGGHAEFDEKTGQLTGVGLHVAPGLGISTTGEATDVFSARRGMSQLTNEAARAADRVVDRIDRLVEPRPRIE